MQRYLIIYERTANNWAAYSPDLPGCVTTGRTRTEVQNNMREAIEFHLDGLREDGLPMPEGSLSTDSELSVEAGFLEVA